MLQPVWDGYCADPFVLRDGDHYVMYGSAPALLPDGRAFQTLHSEDLIHWVDGGGALEPVRGAPPLTEYWAPEVMAADGRFWMYYSVGVGDVGHGLRVAVADEAGGPFLDLGVGLTPDLPFAIDPSPFLDVDGRRWLFFATDKLDSDRPGTVLAVAPMDGLAMLGRHRILLTASEDWQRYQANRRMYGAHRDWHTLEGPQVVHRRGRYWMFYSAGNWHDASYGVGLAVADAPMGPWLPDGSGASFLNSTTTGLTGPGHNSVVTDPQGNDYAVFHAWDDQRLRRRPHVAAIRWDHDGPHITG